MLIIVDSHKVNKILNIIFFRNLVSLHKTLRIFMENLNRIKGALTDAGKTGVWIARQLGKDLITVSKWCTTPPSPICRRWQRSRNS